MTAMAWQSCGVWNETCRPTPAQQARAARLVAQIAETAQAGFILPGTLTEQMTRCGYPAAAVTPTRPPARPLPPVDPQDNGKTVTRILTDDQIAGYKPWFDNQRRLRELDRRAGNPQPGDHRQ